MQTDEPPTTIGMEGSPELPSVKGVSDAPAKTFRESMAELNLQRGTTGTDNIITAEYGDMLPNLYETASNVGPSIDVIKAETITKDPNFVSSLINKVQNQDYSGAGGEVLDAFKKVGKAVFMKDGQLDKPMVLGTAAFALSFAEAKAIANEAGIDDYTEAQYDEDQKAEKKAEYASYLTNFFAGKKEGGRIGFAEGSDDKKINPENYFDPRNLNTEDLILLVRNNRGTPEIFRELMLRDVTGIDSLMLDEIGGKKLDKPQEVFQVNEEQLKDYRINRRSPIEGFLYDLRENNPDIYGEYREPPQFMPVADNRANGGRIGYSNGGIDMIALQKEVLKYPEKVNEITDIEEGVAEPGKPVSPESTIFMRFDKEKEEADMLKELLRELEADGGRIGYKSGSIPNPYAPVGMTNYGFIEDSILDFYYGGDLDSFYEAYGITTKADGGRIGLMSGSGSKKKYGEGIMSGVKQIDPLQEGLGELKMGGGGGLPLAFTRLEKSFLFKHLAKLGGADRSFTMPQLYRILSNPSKYPKDATMLKEFLKIKGFSKGGDVGSVNEIPVRTNKAGVKELDMRSTGGFVPIGVKEKADDVPAMLSKNEFVLTADAVRGIGEGSVEKGSEKLYNLMKSAEQVGKA